MYLNGPYRIFCYLKFRFSKKATKFETISHMIWRLLSFKCQIKWEIFWVLNFCGLFRTSELYQILCLFVLFLNFFMLCFMFHFFFTFFSSRASRDEMAASAGATTAFPKSDSQNSGLVGNIHGQDVEASKGGSGGLVYWAEKGVAILWVVPRPSTLPDEPHALLWFVIDLQFKLHTCSLVHLMYSLVKFI